MADTESITKGIRNRNSAINTDINYKIKHLQRQLVSYSFTQGVSSSRYFETLGKIKQLRRQIFDNAAV